MREKPLILVVDDDGANLFIFQTILTAEGYDVDTAMNGEEALAAVAERQPDLVLLDAMMPVMNGYEAATALKRDPATQHIPIVMITALTDIEDRIAALNAGVDDFLNKPVDRIIVKARVKSLLKVKAYNDHMLSYQRELESEVRKRTEQVTEAYTRLRESSLETIIRLSKAAEYRDSDTGAHILRMSNYSAAIARRLNLQEEACERILHAAPLHDIGKIGIPDNILMKPGPLDPEEWKIMRTHTSIGRKILSGSQSKNILLAEEIAFTHHEKWDGTGYPQGLKGETIPLPGRIVALADVFDALTSKRPYKEPYSLERAVEIICEGRGSHFDPEIVDAFMEIHEEVTAIHGAFRDDTENILATSPAVP